MSELRKQTQEVQIEGTAIIKILQHLEENEEFTTGHLLGLETQELIKITNSFPIPESARTPAEVENFNKEMCLLFKDLGFESTVFGWYQKPEEGTFFDINSVEYQFYMQKEFSNALMLLLDPAGEFPFRAFRLSSQFMDFFESEEFTIQKARDSALNCQKLFEEVPFSVVNTNLSNAFIAQYAPDTEEVPSQDSFKNYLEENLEGMQEGLEELIDRVRSLDSHVDLIQKQKQQIAEFEVKRAEENKERVARGERPLDQLEGSGSLYRVMPQPSRLDSLLIQQQLYNLSAELKKYSTQAQEKIEIFQSLQQ